MIFALKKYLRSLESTEYNNKLIKTLNKDHKKLISLYLALEELLDNEEKFQKQLDKFLKELTLHLTLENSKLYTHLEKKYKYCDISEIQKIKNEIPNNSYLFDELLEQVKNKNIQKAKEIYETIKEFLIKRIKFEEELLYDSYLNTKQCQDLEKLLANH